MARRTTGEVERYYAETHAEEARRRAEHAAELAVYGIPDPWERIRCPNCGAERERRSIFEDDCISCFRVPPASLSERITDLFRYGWFWVTLASILTYVYAR